MVSTQSEQEGEVNPFTFVDTLDARRLALGLSVKDFADLIGVSIPTASRWLNGAVSGKGPYLMAEAEARLREAEDWVEKQTIGEGDSLTDDAERWPVGMRKVAYARRLTAKRNSSAKAR